MRSVGDREPRQILDCRRADQIERYHKIRCPSSHQTVAGLELWNFFLVGLSLGLMAMDSAVQNSKGKIYKYELDR